MDFGNESEELFSDHEEDTSDRDAIPYSSESECDEDEPALSNTVPLLSKKQPRQRCVSEKRRESGRSTSGSGYYEEWLKRRDCGRTVTHPSDARTPSGRPSRRITELEQTADSSPTAVFSALGDLNNTVSKLVKRIEKQEMRLESMEEKLNSTSLSSSASESRAKVTRKVPVVVKVSRFLLADCTLFL